MAIRIRKVNGKYIALCAAETNAHDRDIYLDDNIHHALTKKFEDDFKKEGLIIQQKITGIGGGEGPYNG